MIKQTDHYQNQFSAAWSGLPGYKTSWLDHLRLKAINRFAQKGFPRLREEDWKYTDLSSLSERPFAVGLEPHNILSREKIRALLGKIEASLVLVFVNGHYVQTIGQAAEFPGVLLTSLKETIGQRSVLLKDYLAAYSTSMTAFETLNTAFMNDGACLLVDPGVQLEKPVVLLQIASDDSEQQHINIRNLLVFGEDSKVTVLEKYVGEGRSTSYLTNTVTQTIVKTGAAVEYIKIQDETPAAFHFAVNRITLQENSRFDSHSYAFGGRLARDDLKIVFAGEHTECYLNGLFMVDGERQIDTYTDVEHKVPNCRSESNYRGILDQRGKGVFRGKIKVHQDAQKTDAKLNNANLILADGAEMNTMPQLEIYADDVKCSHGTGSGRLDEEQLFYLTARGIDETTAHNLLVFAFANSIIDRISSKQVKSFVRNQALSRLPASALTTELLQ
jgi:Fe-S cluster assembly protein SufD